MGYIVRQEIPPNSKLHISTTIPMSNILIDKKK